MAFRLTTRHLEASQEATPDPSPEERLRSSLKILFTTLLLTGSTFAAVAQEETPISRMMETVDVRVINIDVVVSDRKGNPVKNLKASDFEVLENGVRQNISNFYEVSGASVTADGKKTETAPEPGEAAPAERVTQKRRFIIFIDNVSMAPFNRNRVFKAMKSFIATSMQPGDEAMIATFNRSLKVRVPFTGEVIQLQQTLDAIAKESAQGTQLSSERTQAESSIRDATSYDQAINIARQYASSAENDTRMTITAIKSLISTVAGVEGKKILVLTSEGIPMQPGKEVFTFVDEISAEKTDWNHLGSSFLEGSHFNASFEIESIAAVANANGITIYPLHAAGLGAYNNASAENRLATSSMVQQVALNNSGDSMRLIADLTGGVASVGTSNFDRAFATINRDLSSYYSLGYRAGTERVDRQRNIVVRTKNHAYVARSRRSFVEKSIGTEMSDRVIANLYYDSSTNDLQVFTTTGPPSPVNDGNYAIPVEIHIPFSQLTLIPQGEMMVGGFTVYVAAANKSGDMSDVGTQNQQLRIPLAEYEKVKTREYTYTVPMIMERGRNRISVGVVDELSRETGFVRQEVLAADLH